LLGEADKIFGFEEVGAFSGAGGGETPAAATLSLVLDGGYGTVVSPIPGRRNIVHLYIWHCTNFDIKVHTIVKCYKLFCALIGVTIQSHRVPFGNGIVSFYKFVVITENQITLVVFCERGVGPLILALPFEKGSFGVSLRRCSKR